MDFHPRMLASQRTDIRSTGSAPKGSFHPHMLATQQLSNLDAVTAPAAVTTSPGTQLPGGMSIDLSTGTLYVQNVPIKLIPAIASALALKVIFFSGNLAAEHAKKFAGKFKKPALATNPRRRKARR